MTPAVAVLLGLLVAISYGAADFLGGVASRRVPAALVVQQSQLLGVVLLLVMLAVVPDQHVIAADMVRGAGAGMGGLLGLVLLYRGLAVGAMSIVAPITAVGAAVLPVGWGLATGERPGTVALAGVVLALVAVALVATPATEDAAPVEGRRREILLALLAGGGFGIVFILFGDTAKASGMWPLLSARVVSTIVVTTGLWFRHIAIGPRKDSALVVAGAGVLDVTANTLFIVGARIGLVSLVAVLSSLYPAATVVLARVVLDERVSRRQATGLVLAIVGVVLIALA
jgi:drug/metabolite transporter (DMT)-like permease